MLPLLYSELFEAHGYEYTIHENSCTQSNVHSQRKHLNSNKVKMFNLIRKEGLV